MTILVVEGAPLIRRTIITAFTSALYDVASSTDPGKCTRSLTNLPRMRLSSDPKS